MSCAIGSPFHIVGVEYNNVALRIQNLQMCACKHLVARLIDGCNLDPGLGKAEQQNAVRVHGASIIGHIAVCVEGECCIGGNGISVGCDDCTQRVGTGFQTGDLPGCCCGIPFLYNSAVRIQNLQVRVGEFHIIGSVDCRNKDRMGDRSLGYGVEMTVLKNRRLIAAAVQHHIALRQLDGGIGNGDSRAGAVINRDTCRILVSGQIDHAGRIDNILVAALDRAAGYLDHTAFCEDCRTADCFHRTARYGQLGCRLAENYHIHKNIARARHRAALNLQLSTVINIDRRECFIDSEQHTCALGGIAGTAVDDPDIGIASDVQSISGERPGLSVQINGKAAAVDDRFTSCGDIVQQGKDDFILRRSVGSCLKSFGQDGIFGSISANSNTGNIGSDRLFQICSRHGVDGNRHGVPGFIFLAVDNPAEEVVSIRKCGCSGKFCFSVYRGNRRNCNRIAVHIEAQDGFCGRQLCVKTGKAIRTANIDRKTGRTGRLHRQCTVSYSDFVPADCIDILAVGNILEYRTAGKRNQCQAVNVCIRVTADKRHVSADVVSIRGVLTLSECRNLLAQFIEHPDML